MTFTIETVKYYIDILVTDFYSVPENSDISGIADFEHATDILHKIDVSYCKGAGLNINGVILWFNPNHYIENLLLGPCMDSSTDSF